MRCSVEHIERNTLGKRIREAKERFGEGQGDGVAGDSNLSGQYGTEGMEISGTLGDIGEMGYMGDLEPVGGFAGNAQAGPSSFGVGHTGLTPFMEQDFGSQIDQDPLPDWLATTSSVNHVDRTAQPGQDADDSLEQFLATLDDPSTRANHSSWDQANIPPDRVTPLNFDVSSFLPTTDSSPEHVTLPEIPQDAHLLFSGPSHAARKPVSSVSTPQTASPLPATPHEQAQAIWRHFGDTPREAIRTLRPTTPSNSTEGTSTGEDKVEKYRAQLVSAPTWQMDTVFNAVSDSFVPSPQHSPGVKRIRSNGWSSSPPKLAASVYHIQRDDWHLWSPPSQAIPVVWGRREQVSEKLADRSLGAQLSRHLVHVYFQAVHMNYPVRHYHTYVQSATSGLMDIGAQSGIIL